MSEAKWLVLKLTRLGEQSTENILNSELKRIFGKDIDVFFPFKFPPTNYSKKITVLEGYVFLKNCINYNLDTLDSSYYFDALLHNSSYVEAEYVDKLKLKLKNLCECDFYEGEDVLITDGPYSNLSGNIISVDKKAVIVHIAIRSRELRVSIPKTSIQRFCP